MCVNLTTLFSINYYVRGIRFQQVVCDQLSVIRAYRLPPLLLDTPAVTIVTLVHVESAIQYTPIQQYVIADESHIFKLRHQYKLRCHLKGVASRKLFY